MAYPALPTCDVRRAGETLPEYAARVLRHLLATDCTATLTDEQLSLADMAAQRAAATLAGGGDATHADRPSRLDAAQLHTVETLSAARRSIDLVLTWRRQDDARRAAGDQPAPRASHPQPGAQGGRPAMLPPPPPTRPGAPDALDDPSNPDGYPARAPFPPLQRRPADGIRF